MLCFESNTSVPLQRVRSVFSNWIHGAVSVRRIDNLYIIRCEQTPEYNALVSSMDDNVYIQLSENVMVRVRLYTPSKL